MALNPIKGFFHTKYDNRGVFLCQQTHFENKAEAFFLHC